MNSYLVICFYKFTSLPDYQLLKEPLLNSMVEFNIKGTLILASEGINGSFCGNKEDVDRMIDYLRSYPAFADIYFKINYSDFNPFDKSKVKLRKEIVSMGVEGVDAVANTGIHVKPEEWNALIEDEEVMVIDTRNDYEIALGTFSKAINPKTINFREFPEYVENNMAQGKKQKIAMFCTGGIRCEKTTAYLKEQGFEQVYQLDGGILNYLEVIPENQSLWQGSCFVFDNRVAVDHQLQALTPGTIDLEWKNKHRSKDSQD